MDGDLQMLPGVQMVSAAPWHCVGLMGICTLLSFLRIFLFFNPGGCCVICILMSFSWSVVPVICAFWILGT